MVPQLDQQQQDPSVRLAWRWPWRIVYVIVVACACLDFFFFDGLLVSQISTSSVPASARVSQSGAVSPVNAAPAGDSPARDSPTGAVSPAGAPPAEHPPAPEAESKVWRTGPCEKGGGGLFVAAGGGANANSPGDGKAFENPAMELAAVDVNTRRVFKIPALSDAKWRAGQEACLARERILFLGDSTQRSLYKAAAVWAATPGHKVVTDPQSVGKTAEANLDGETLDYYVPFGADDPEPCRKAERRRFAVPGRIHEFLEFYATASCPFMADPKDPRSVRRLLEEERPTVVIVNSGLWDVLHYKALKGGRNVSQIELYRENISRLARLIDEERQRLPAKNRPRVIFRSTHVIYQHFLHDVALVEDMNRAGAEAFWARGFEVFHYDQFVTSPFFLRAEPIIQQAFPGKSLRAVWADPNLRSKFTGFDAHVLLDGTHVRGAVAYQIARGLLTLACPELRVMSDNLPIEPDTFPSSAVVYNTTTDRCQTMPLRSYVSSYCRV